VSADNTDAAVVAVAVAVAVVLLPGVDAGAVVVMGGRALGVPTPIPIKSGSELTSGTLPLPGEGIGL